MATATIVETATPPLVNSNSKRKRALCSEILVHPQEQPALKQPRRQSHVTFALEQNQISDKPILEEDVDDDQLWFTCDELRQIRVREACIVQNKRNSDHYMEQVSCLLEQVSSEDGTENDTNTNDRDIDDCSDTSLDAPLLIANSEARGLERETLATFRQHRKEAIQSLLKSQDALKRWRGAGDKQFSFEFQRRALSEHYQRLTRPSAKFAQLIGQADADVVMEEVSEGDQEELDSDTFEW